MILDSFAADVLIKVTIVLAAAALVARALTSRSAAVRHHVWALALGASLALPVLTSVAPRWTIAVLPAHRSATREGGPPQSSPEQPDTGTVSAPVVVDNLSRAESRDVPPQTTNIVDDGAPVAPPPGLMPSSNAGQPMSASDTAAYGGMYTAPPAVPMPPSWLYYIRVESADDAAGMVKSLGGQVLTGPMDVPGGDRIAQCLDPQGGIFALHSVTQR